MFQITASPSARSRQFWRRTENFFWTFLQFYVYDLRFKTAGLTTFLIEFWTLHALDTGNHFLWNFCVNKNWNTGNISGGLGAVKVWSRFKGAHHKTTSKMPTSYWRKSCKYGRITVGGNSSLFPRRYIGSEQKSRISLFQAMACRIFVTITRTIDLLSIQPLKTSVC